MARNSEKAQSMLFRFREAQAADLGIIDAGRTRRPKNILEVDTIPSAEKWRGQTLKEISRKVSKIQDPALSDYQIRDLNDEINKLMREKHMWEVQIRNLGGPNYMMLGKSGGGGKMYDETGREIPGGGKGYKYFGRARELPGVKELFEAAAASRGKNSSDKPLESRDDLRKAVDATYYGYAPDEEDEELLRYEGEKEQEAYDLLMRQAGPLGGTASGTVTPNSGRGGAGTPVKGRGAPRRSGAGGMMVVETPPGWEALPGDSGDGRGWDLPTPQEVQEELMERRRRKLLDQIA